MKLLFLFDLFSQTPSLKVNGGNSPQTIFGSIIGLASIITLIFGMIYILYDYYSQLSYNFSSYTDNSIIPDIDFKKFRMGFVVTDSLGNPVPNLDRLFSIKATHWDIYFNTNTSSVEIKISDIPKIKCSNYAENDPIFKVINSTLNTYGKTHGMECLDFEAIDKNLTGIYNNFGG